MLFLLAPCQIVAFYIARHFWERHQLPNLDTKAILITGCDTGFGRALALKCSQAGMTVFAGCLTQKGVESLREEDARGGVHAILLDITKEESVMAAREYVNRNIGDKTFWAVVNNAGIFTCYGPVDWCSIDEYRLSMEVNCFGGIRVTKAFDDLVKRSKGCVVSVSSIAGFVSASGWGAYSVGKYGVEAWMDCLRREYSAFGVKCILLEPGVFKNTMLLDEAAMASRVEKAWNGLSDERKEEYGSHFKDQNISFVVDNYFHAITAIHPRPRYQCGWDALLVWLPLSYLPTQWQVLRWKYVIDERFEDFLHSLVMMRFPVPALAYEALTTIMSTF